jgi:hypothetical protein
MPYPNFLMFEVRGLGLPVTSQGKCVIRDQLNNIQHPCLQADRLLCRRFLVSLFSVQKIIALKFIIHRPAHGDSEKLVKQLPESLNLSGSLRG